MFLVNIFLSVSTITSFLLGLFIIVSNPRRSVNRALFGFLLGIFLWLLSNLLTNLSADPGVSLFFARTTLIGACILPYTFMLFCNIYTKQANFGYNKALKLLVPPLLIAATFPTELNIVSIEAYGKNTVTGLIYFLLTPLILAYFIWGFLILTKYYRRSRNLSEKAQIRYIYAGFGLTLIPAVIANAILPALGINTAILYGPNAVMALAIFMSIAIVRHRLLDIRLIVARSIAYLLLFSTVIGMYGIVVFVVATQLFGSNQFSQQIVPVFAAIFLAFTIQPLQKYFDRITNKLFYRDAYEPEVFLDELNKVLVSTIELDTLVKGIIVAVEENLKADYTVFSIRETSYFKNRIIGDNAKHFNDNDIQEISEITSHIHEKVIITDFLEEDNHELRRTLERNDIAVLIRLVATLDYDVKGIGYVLLGPKRSGNPYNKQDIQTLEIIANELVIAVQNALRFEEIEKFNATLQEKIDDATKKLQKTNEKLEALDETKDEFISMASHQLRTPLTSVKGYLSMVLEGDAGEVSEMQRKLLDQAFTSSQRMVYLIADLLNVSRLRTGKFLIEPIATNLADVIESEAHQLAETAKARDLDLTFDKPDKFPTLMLDETKIRQVIMNFMDNAIYYSKPGGHIKVGLKETDKTIEYTVTDDGIGVPKSEQHHLFTKFYRAGNAKKARPDGTGLGLFMAKKVIVAQGGAIIFKSEEGKGSTFGFTFDKSKLQPPTPPQS